MTLCKVCHTEYSETVPRHSFFWFSCKFCMKRARTKSRFHRRRRKAVGTFAPSDWLIKLLEYEFKCAECNQKKPNLTLDHIRSLTDGGENVYNNIQPLCEECHNGKAHQANIEALGHHPRTKKTRRERRLARLTYRLSFDSLTNHETLHSNARKLGGRDRATNSLGPSSSLSIAQPDSSKQSCSGTVFGSSLLSGVRGGFEREWFMLGQFLPTACLDCGPEGVVPGPTWSYPENLVRPESDSGRRTVCSERRDEQPKIRVEHPHVRPQQERGYRGLP